MPQINLLSQSTIDKIAAGEVVERPLSVVKELTENAIDAGADAITVEIKEGGISLIRVTDNGCGIEKNQVKKAFLRHATSKITSIEDLDYVSSLGFRGEALSSIAAVAQIEVITKTKDDLTGVRYTIAGGVEEDTEEVGAPSGTTFIVRNLFYNVPARKKFLKQPQTEGSYVSDMMEHLALSHPEISIKFVGNGQVRFHTSGNNNLKEVIYRIYGKEITDALIPFETSFEGVSVTGFLGKPEINRSNRNFEIYFVNGRYVHNDMITKAMEEGYRAYVMQHKFPFFVLHFTMEPASIDVNVHPAKMEIRLHKGQALYEALSGAVKETLQKIELIPDVKLTQDREEKNSVLKAPEPFEINRKQQEAIDAPQVETVKDTFIPGLLKEETAEYKAAQTEKNTSVIKAAALSSDQPVIPAQQSKLPEAPNVQDFLQRINLNRIIGDTGSDKQAQNDKMHANVIKADQHILVEKPTQLNLFEEKLLSVNAKDEYRILGQIFDTYWLIAFHDKLFIMDQHAAHEKVKYERLYKELSEKQISSQMLNPPVILTLTSKEEQLLKEQMSSFEELGFEIEEFGSGSYAIRSMPSDLYGCSEKELFTDILDELAENPMKGSPEVVLNKLASMACKAAVKGNNRLSLEEAESLIDELLALENPYHCPHGRPTIISMSKYEIEKKFKRIV